MCFNNNLFSKIDIEGKNFKNFNEISFSQSDKNLNPISFLLLPYLSQYLFLKSKKSAKLSDLFVFPSFKDKMKIISYVF